MSHPFNVTCFRCGYENVTTCSCPGEHTDPAESGAMLCCRCCEFSVFDGGWRLPTTFENVMLHHFMGAAVAAVRRARAALS